MDPEISVVISTYNRYNFLDRALESLQRQTFDRNRFEILIIDASPPDGIPEKIRNYSGILPARFISSPGISLSDARNHGITDAKGGIIAFLDDDAVADPGWLDEIQKTFQITRPRISACGGKSLLFPEEPPPSWLTDGMLSFLGHMDYGDNGFVMDGANQYPIGLNMAFRRQVFDHLGFFNSRLGRSGGSLLSNEEVDYFRKMRSHDLKIYYNPKMLVYHQVAKDRLTKDFFYRRYFWQGCSDAVMDAENKFTIRGSARILFRSLVKPLRILRIRFISQFNSYEQKRVVYRCTLEYHRGYIGQILGILGS
jgi:glycosyltransferase involved in cell wall biosynthesis